MGEMLGFGQWHDDYLLLKMGMLRWFHEMGETRSNVVVTISSLRYPHLDADRSRDDRADKVE